MASELGAKNVATVKEALACDPPNINYFGGGADFKAETLAGVVPGGANIRGLEAWAEFMKTFPEKADVTKFEPG